MKSLITFTHSRELNWTDLDNPDPQNPDQLYQSDRMFVMSFSQICCLNMNVSNMKKCETET